MKQPPAFAEGCFIFNHSVAVVLLLFALRGFFYILINAIIFGIEIIHEE